MGAFLYRDRAKQLIDFTNLSWGKIHPTDVDAIMEFDGKKLILFEYKTKGKDADMGQKLLLERMADNWKSTRKDADAIVIYAEHEQYDPHNDIDGGEATVKEIYWNKQYIPFINRHSTVRQLVWSFANEEILGQWRKEECLQLKP